MFYMYNMPWMWMNTTHKFKNNMTIKAIGPWHITTAHKGNLFKSIIILTKICKSSSVYSNHQYIILQHYYFIYRAHSNICFQSLDPVHLFLLCSNFGGRINIARSLCISTHSVLAKSLTSALTLRLPMYTHSLLPPTLNNALNRC